MRQMAKMILETFTGKAIHPHAGVPGGFSKPLLEEDRKDFLAKMREMLDFALFTIEFAKTEIFPKYLDAVKTLGVIKTGFIGTVDGDGALNLYDGMVRLMKPDGTFQDFDPQQYDRVSRRARRTLLLRKIPLRPMLGGRILPGSGSSQGHLPGQYPGKDQCGG